MKISRNIAPQKYSHHHHPKKMMKMCNFGTISANMGKYGHKYGKYGWIFTNMDGNVAIWTKK